MLDADCVFASPLTRALQTALLALSPLLQKKPELKLVLMPELREAVDAVHYDSMGKVTGDEIVARAITKTEQTFNETRNTSDTSMPGPASAEWRDMKAMWNQRVDPEFARTEWWSSTAEPDEIVQARGKDFLKFLRRRTSCQRSIAVGHSAHIRELFRSSWNDERYLDQMGNSYPSEVLKKKKLSNAGVASTSLAGKLDDPYLKDVQLVLDTHLVD